MGMADVVHAIKSLTSFTKRGESMVEVTTGCRESLTLVQPRGASLLDIGVSGWHSDVTCEACKNQAKTPEEG